MRSPPSSCLMRSVPPCKEGSDSGDVGGEGNHDRDEGTREWRRRDFEGGRSRPLPSCPPAAGVRFRSGRRCLRSSAPAWRGHISPLRRAGCRFDVAAEPISRRTVTTDRGMELTFYEKPMYCHSSLPIPSSETHPSSRLVTAALMCYKRSSNEANDPPKIHDHPYGTCLPVTGEMGLFKGRSHDAKEAGRASRRQNPRSTAH
jgi:hypothetical protein